MPDPEAGRYGPQESARYEQARAEMERKYPGGQGTKPRARPTGLPRTLVARPSRATAAASNGGEVIVEEVEAPVYGGSSGQKSQYVTPNYQQHVFIAIGLAFILTLLAAKYRGDRSIKTANQYLDPSADPVKFSIAWLVIVVVLFAGASFRGPDKLAAAFAWLIFIAIALTNGEEALQATGLIGGGTPVSTTSGTGGKPPLVA